MFVFTWCCALLFLCCCCCVLHGRRLRSGHRWSWRLRMLRRHHTNPSLRHWPRDNTGSFVRRTCWLLLADAAVVIATRVSTKATDGSDGGSFWRSPVAAAAALTVQFVRCFDHGKPCTPTTPRFAQATRMLTMPWTSRHSARNKCAHEAAARATPLCTAAHATYPGENSTAARGSRHGPSGSDRRGVCGTHSPHDPQLTPRSIQQCSAHRATDGRERALSDAADTAPFNR